MRLRPHDRGVSLRQVRLRPRVGRRGALGRVADGRLRVRADRFPPCRALRALGLGCVVGAVSKMHSPAADRGRKNDRRDAERVGVRRRAATSSRVWVLDERAGGGAHPRAPSRTRETISSAPSSGCRSSRCATASSSTRRRRPAGAGAPGRGPTGTANPSPSTSLRRRRGLRALYGRGEGVRRRQEGPRAQGGGGRHVSAGAGRRRALPGEGHRRRERLPARRRGRRLLRGSRARRRSSSSTAWCGLAPGALERRDGVARRDHARRQRPRPPRAGRGRPQARPDVDEAPEEAEARARGRAGRVEARREVQPPPAGEARGDVRGGQEALRGELRDGAGDGLPGVGDSGDGLVTSPRR